MEQMPLPDKEQLLGKAVIYELKLLSHIPYGVDIYLETNYYWLLATVEKKKKKKSVKLRLLVVIIIQIQGGVLKQKSQEDSPLYVKALVKGKYGQTDALNEMENTLKLHFITSAYKATSSQDAMSLQGSRKTTDRQRVEGSHFKPWTVTLLDTRINCCKTEDIFNNIHIIFITWQADVS